MFNLLCFVSIPAVQKSDLVMANTEEFAKNDTVTKKYTKLIFIGPQKWLKLLDGEEIEYLALKLLHLKNVFKKIRAGPMD
jgi:hypothetical protein